MGFVPFDDDYAFDSAVLTEDFPPYLMPGVKKWIFSTLEKHAMFRGIVGRGMVLDTFLHPLNRALRTSIDSNDGLFFDQISSRTVLFRNVLSYMLQNVAEVNESHELEKILSEGSSAYAVEFIKGERIMGLSRSDGEPLFKHAGCTLKYRVSPIVKKQAEEIISNEELLNQAWDLYYGLKPDDEKTVVRCTDAVSGLLRDRFFPGDKRPVFGTMLEKIKQNPKNYTFPANTLYETADLVKMMKEFSKIRGNHQKGTGRMPTHQEAGFVLHFSILLFQLFKSDTLTN